MRKISSGQFELAAPATEAIHYFTPEGERGWAPGWDPVYSAGEPSESPGTVFTTGGGTTIWLILEIDRAECTATYSRVTPGHHAGTVTVRCTRVETNRCVVAVTYDMSLLSGGDPAELDHFAEPHFRAMMQEWATAIGELLESHDEPT